MNRIWRVAKSLPLPLALEPGELHVWQAALATDPRANCAKSDLLSRSERRRAAQFTRPVDRERNAAKWVILRSLLASYLGTCPRDIEISRTEHGKPHLLAENTIKISLSSSGDIAAFVISNGLEVGVDIEQVRHLPDSQDIADRFFAPLEKQNLSDVAPERREREFFRYWVCKEALLKATGKGLYAPLDYFSLGTASDGAMEIASVDGDQSNVKNWWLEDFSVAVKSVGAVAANGVPRAVRYLIWDESAQLSVCSDQPSQVEFA